MRQSTVAYPNLRKRYNGEVLILNMAVSRLHRSIGANLHPSSEPKGEYPQFNAKMQRISREWTSQIEGLVLLYQVNYHPLKNLAHFQRVDNHFSRF